MSRNLAEWVKNHSKNSKRSSPESELIVVGLASGADASVLGRLGDLGLSSGETIVFFGVAPLGEPIYISVRETVIALRLQEAAFIQVVDATDTKVAGEA